MRKKKPGYSLQAIAKEKEVNCEGNTSGEVWCAIIDQIINKGSGAKKFDIVENKEVAAVKRYAIPVFVSAAMRPDIHVQLISKDTGGTGVLQCEIHSSPFKKTVPKCAIGLVHQLMLYRHFNPNICKIIGFALPKLNCIEFVVEVAVCYKEWKYTCEIDHLKQDDIASRIKKALKHNLDFLSEPIRTKVDKFDGKVPSITPTNSEIRGID